MNRHGGGEPSELAPRWTCPACGEWFRTLPYDIGSGRELNCPHCDWCFGADGQQLKSTGELAARHLHPGSRVRQLMARVGWGAASLASSAWRPVLRALTFRRGRDARS